MILHEPRPWMEPGRGAATVAGMVRAFLVLGLAVALGAATGWAEPTLDHALAQAEKEAPGEGRLHIVKTRGRLADFFAKVREVERVEGWRQVRVTGEAACAVWDRHRRDYEWRSEVFEVLWDVHDDGRLKLNAVSLGRHLAQGGPPLKCSPTHPAA